MLFKQPLQSLFKPNRQLLTYGLMLGLLIVLLKVVEYKFLIRDHALEIYIGILALLFTILGIWMGLKLTKTVTVEKLIPTDRDFQLDQNLLDNLGISKREYEVLQLMAEGLSNREIADRLFVSLNTIKTHSSNLFLKLEANRRTQAVKRAKSLLLIP